MKCAKCNHILPEDSEFCQYCGIKIEQIIDPPMMEPAPIVAPISVTSTVPSSTQSSFDTERIMNAKDPVKALMEEQAKETIRIMEANRTAQPNNEEDPEFGLVPEKPIFTLAIDIAEGQKAYLGRLRTATGDKITWKRLGSTSAEGIHGMIDIYETFLPSGQPYKTLYINMYGARRSAAAPQGFCFASNNKEISSSIQTSVKATQSAESTRQNKVTINPNQRYCKHCGHAIDSYTKKCTGCGKQYFKAKFRWGYVALLIVLLFTGYVGVNYSNAISAMNNQKFIEAQQYFDNLLVSETVFADKYEYVEAGVLMEEGKYVEALVAFNKVDDVPVPSSLIDSLKAKIYSAGQAAYKAEKLTDAKKYFNALTGYKRSADYLTLILCSEDSFSNWLGGEDNYKELIKLLDFENADEIMLKYESTALEFLKGRWEDGSKNDPYYFEMEKTSSGDFSDSWSSGYNLPYKDVDGYFYFSNGIYSVGETESSAVKIYRISIINEDTISVYCYKDGSTHKLYRQ